MALLDSVLLRLLTVISYLLFEALIFTHFLFNKILPTYSIVNLNRLPTNILWMGMFGDTAIVHYRLLIVSNKLPIASQFRFQLPIVANKRNSPIYRYFRYFCKIDILKPDITYRRIPVSH